MFSMFSSPGALNLLNIPFIGAEVFAVVCICENSGRPDPILTLSSGYLVLYPNRLLFLPMYDYRYSNDTKGNYLP